MIRYSKRKLLLYLMNRRSTLSLYWRCQLTGWTIASLYWAVSGMGEEGASLQFAAWQFFTDLVLYVGITHVYRSFALHNRWQALPLRPLAVRLLMAVLVLAVLYAVTTLTKIYLIRRWQMPGFSMSLVTFSGEHVMPVFVAGLRLMSIWLLAYHGYHYAMREMRLVKENAQLQLSAKDAQLQNLSAQLNPHFLFNTLNTIKSLVRENPESARRGIDLLSELLRAGLYQGEQQMVKVEDEMSVVKDYLELEQLRLEERLSYEIDIPPGILPVFIPQLSLITMTENAVKHGIAQSAAGGRIVLRGEITGTGYLFSVTHPGTLRGGSGIGLTNLQQRLQLLYGDKAWFSIEETTPFITAQLLIPFTQ